MTSLILKLEFGVIYVLLHVTGKFKACTDTVALQADDYSLHGFILILFFYFLLSEMYE